MKKLELKHLAAYLPYEVSVFRNTGETHNITLLTACIIVLWQGDYYTEFKPILRPLSDLTKEIDVNGEKFVPFEKITQGIRPEPEYLLRDLQNTPLLCKYFIIEMLLSWHFDIFGLIENGLAVDINTLVL